MVLPVSSFGQFGVWDTGQPDAAMSRFIGDLEGQGLAAWTRYWTAATAPAQQLTANGTGSQVWPRASYAGVGVQFTAVPNNAFDYVSAVQFEQVQISHNTTTLASTLAVVTGGTYAGTPSTFNLAAIPSDWPAAPYFIVLDRGNAGQEVVYVQSVAGVAVTGLRGRYSPTAAHAIGVNVSLAEVTDFEEPRTLEILMRGDRVNFVLNPSFEVDLTYVAENNATVARSNTYALYGSYSLSAVAVNPAIPANIVNAFPLKPGTEVTWSCWVYSTTATQIDLTKCFLQEAGGANRTLAVAGTALLPVPAATWTRISGSATLPVDWYGETYIVVVPASNTAGTAWDTTTTVYFDGFLCEAGLALQDYFDGSAVGTPDYFWEEDQFGNTTPGLSRSHCYKNWTAKKSRIASLIGDTIPYGANFRILYAQAPDLT